MDYRLKITKENNKDSKADFFLSSMNESISHLIGPPIKELEQGKFPSKRDVLQLFLHFHTSLKLQIRESARKATEVAIAAYSNMGLKTINKYRATLKLEGLYKKFVIMENHKNRKIKYEAEIKIFKETLNEAFDIKSLNLNVNVQNKNKPKNEDENETQEKAVQLETPLKSRPAKTDCNQVLPVVGVEEDIASDTSDGDWEPSTKRVKINTKKVLSIELSASLDRCGMSNRKAHYIVSTAAEEFDSKLGMSFSTLRRKRIENRSVLATEIKKNFEPDDFLTVHWDGKVLPNFTDGGKGKL